MNARNKGKRREREFANLLRDHGYEARRTAQVRGTVDSFDVESDDPIGRWEVKGRERLNLGATMDQARLEAEGHPFAVAWKKNGRPWTIHMDADLFFKLLGDRNEDR